MATPGREERGAPFPLRIPLPKAHLNNRKRHCQIQQETGEWAPTQDVSGLNSLHSIKYVWASLISQLVFFRPNSPGLQMAFSPPYTALVSSFLSSPVFANMWVTIKIRKWRSSKSQASLQGFLLVPWSPRPQPWPPCPWLVTIQNLNRSYVIIKDVQYVPLGCADEQKHSKWLGILLLLEYLLIKDKIIKKKQ